MLNTNIKTTPKPKLVKAQPPQPQPQPQPKKPSPDREFLQHLRSSGDQVRITLMNGTTLIAKVEWVDTYTIGTRGSVQWPEGGLADENFFWLPKHSILMIEKGGERDG